MKKFLSWVWPPHKAKIINNEILEKIHHLYKEGEWESLCDKLRQPLQNKNADDIKNFEPFVRNIYTDEFKRKDVLEGKASTFFVSNGILVSVLSIIPTLISNHISYLANMKSVLALTYLLSFLHLIMAVYYAVKVREADVVACFTSAIFEENPNIIECKERIAITLARMKFNEYALLIKANLLCIAEIFFIRGLIIMSFTIICGMLTVLFTSP